MASGTVVYFSEGRAYGFIGDPDGSGEDLFFHASKVRHGGHASIRRGARVQFDIADGPKGRRAINVELIHRQR